jgi:hypothetical protein
MKIKDIVSETQMQQFNVQSSDSTGVTMVDPITKVLMKLPADKATAIAQDPNNPGKSIMNPKTIVGTAGQGTAGSTPIGPKPGSVVQVPTLQNTSEIVQDEPPVVAPTKDEGEPINGEDIIQKLQSDPSSLSDHEIEWLQQHLSGNMVDPDDTDGIHPETDKDLIGSGENNPVGNDATDSLINQVRDKDFERHARGGNLGGNVQSTLSENDELYKWLTIAGVK